MGKGYIFGSKNREGSFEIYQRQTSCVTKPLAGSISRAPELNAAQNLSFKSELVQDAENNVAESYGRVHGTLRYWLQ